MSQPVIGVIFYSMYGHITALAEEVIKGVESTGAIVKPYQIQETLPAEVLTKMHAGASLKPKYPIITPDDLTKLDGFLIGSPTRYGRLPAQVSAFFDQTGGLWATGALVGKLVGTFTSTASQHGGQETTHLTTIPFFVHHGCIYVPIGYANPYLTNLTEIHGGSPYGASTLAGADGSHQPTAGELQLAAYQGETFAKTVATFVRGRQLTAAAGTAGTAGTDGTTGTAAAAGTAAAVGAGSTTSAARNLPEEKDAAGYNVDADKPVDAATPAAAGTGATPAAAGAAGATDTTTPATGADAARPTAPAQAKKGGLFSCCSGNSID